MKNQTNLVIYPYGIVLDITKEEIYAKGQKRKSRIVNIYNNKHGEEQTWQGPKQRIEQAIQDFPWRLIINRQVIIMRDINAHSLIWNPHCQIKKNAGLLKELTNSYKLIVNKDSDYATYCSSQGTVSIIDLSLSSSKLRPLCIWKILKEYSSLWDHELILLGWEDMNKHSQFELQKNATEWSIQNLLEDKRLLLVAKKVWMECSLKRPYLSSTSVRYNLDQEVEWFESKLSLLLDKNAKVLHVSPFSKR